MNPFRVKYVKKRLIYEHQLLEYPFLQAGPPFRYFTALDGELLNQEAVLPDIGFHMVSGRQ